MAKKSKGPSKSQEIRDYYAANPDAKPRQVVEALAEKGISVSPAFVSTIKSTSAKKSPRGRASTRSVKGAPRGRRPKAVSVKAASAELSIESLIKAKSLATSLGGVDNALAALTALKRLGD